MRTLAATLVLLLSLAALARADSAPPVPLDALIDGAEEIVVGEVLSSEGRWDGSMVVTDVRVRVDDSLKGTPPREVTLTQPGGTAMHPRLGARVTTQASSATPFGVGEHVVLFVAQRQGTRRLVGGAQGKLVVAPQPTAPAGARSARRDAAVAVGPKRLEPSASGYVGTRGMTLDELRARVDARKGAKP
ncbi:MAG TPA: hypothetical protein VGR62_03715 [Candidatus Binatia bacterium]|jgi:hypothetical protein|nr:hypothetical protein [Candidatus Binatia bacterium]